MTPTALLIAGLFFVGCMSAALPFPYGLLAVGAVSATCGILVAELERRIVRIREHRVHAAQGAMTLRDVQQFLSELGSEKGSNQMEAFTHMPIYFADPAVKTLTGVTFCHYDGQQALLFTHENKVAPIPETVEELF